MTRWFRFYAEAMRDPKVVTLSDKDFRLWVNLLSIASENDGNLPSIDGLKGVLKVRLDHLLAALKRLISAGLIDPLEGGYKPHGWEKRQYISDTSTERVKKHRGKCNVSVTPPDSDTDTDKRKKEKISEFGAERGVTIDLNDSRWPVAKARYRKETGKPLNASKWTFPERYFEPKH